MSRLSGSRLKLTREGMLCTTIVGRGWCDGGVGGLLAVFEWKRLNPSQDNVSAGAAHCMQVITIERSFQDVRMRWHLLNCAAQQGDPERSSARFVFWVMQKIAKVCYPLLPLLSSIAESLKGRTIRWFRYRPEVDAVLFARIYRNSLNVGPVLLPPQDSLLPRYAPTSQILHNATPLCISSVSLEALRSILNTPVASRCASGANLLSGTDELHRGSRARPHTVLNSALRACVAVVACGVCSSGHV